MVQQVASAGNQFHRCRRGDWRVCWPRMTRHAVLMLLGTAAAALVCACARLPRPPSTPALPPAVLAAPRASLPRSPVIGVLVDGWHSALILPVSELGPLRALLPRYTGENYVSFGWGNRRFFMSPHPTLYDALAALFSSPSVMLVQGAPTMHALVPAGASYRWLCARRNEVRRVDAYLRTALRTVEGKPVRLGAGPRAGSAFFASSERYDALHTCNTWTADALRYAGLPVRVSGVIFSSQLEHRIGKLSDCPDITHP